MSDPFRTLRHLDGIYHYNRIPLMEDALMLGWLPTDALRGTPHGEWSVLCRWPCGCKMVVPG